VALRFPPHSKNVAVVEETDAITSNRQSPASTLKYLCVWLRCGCTPPIVDLAATKGHTVCLERICDSPASPHFVRYATRGRGRALRNLILATRLAQASI